jgi:hypothetical protein
LFIHAGMSDGRDEVKDEGLKDVGVDEGCNRVMEDQGEMDGGGNGINRARCLHHGGNAK